jgi:SsrA-binding protein
MSETKTIAKNRKAYFNYEIISKHEAGIVLRGCEIKSIRAGKASLADSFARVDNCEMWLYNLHIDPYTQGNRYNEEPKRTRKLLLKKKEIYKLMGKTEEKGLALIPLSLYLKNNKAKIELALGKSKRKFDKRKKIKEREVNREIARGLKN